MKVKITLFLLVVFSLAPFIYPQSAFFNRRTTPQEERKKERTKEAKALLSLSKSIISPAAESGGAAKAAGYTPGRYYVESFEGDFPPSGWQVRNVSGGGSWEKYTSEGHSGYSSAFIMYDYTAVDWLITPQYTVYSGDSLVFYLQPYAGGYPDMIWVLVSSSLPEENYQLDAAFTDTLFAVRQDTLINDFWNKFIVSLDEYAGEQIYIGFKQYNDDGGGTLLDDVKLGKQPVKDAAALSVNMKGSISVGTPSDISAVFHNVGSVIQSFPVICEVSGAGYSSEQMINDLVPESFSEVVFDQWTPAMPGVYTVKVYPKLAGEENTSNDTLAVQVTVYESYPGLNWHYEANMPQAIENLGAASYIKKSGDPPVADTPFIYVTGGASNYQPNKSIYKYNALSRAWSKANTEFSNLMLFKSAQIGGKIYMAGGAEMSGLPVSDLYIYDIEADTLGRGDYMPTPNAAYAMGTYGDSLIYVIGGATVVNWMFIPLNTVMIYNINTNTWDYGTSFPGAGLAYTGGSICGNKIVIAGGEYALDDYSSDVYTGVINPDNPYDIEWTYRGDYPEGAFMEIAAGAWHGKDRKYIYFTGGYKGTPVTYPRETWLYDVQADKWLAGPNRNYGAGGTSSLIPVVRNDSVYMAVLGGYYQSAEEDKNEWLYIGANDAYQGIDAALVSVDFDTVIVGEQIIPKATIKNKGVNPEFIVTLIEITPGDYYSGDTIGVVAPRTAQQLSFAPWTPDTVGVYTAKVYLYMPLNNDEILSNDTLISKIVVRTKGLDVSPFSVDFDTIAVHSAYTPKAAFENKEWLPRTFVTTMEINPGGYISIDTVENLAPYTKRQVSFASWTPEATGTYAVKIYTYLPGDENTSNDTLTSTVVVVNQGLDVSPFSVDFDTAYVNAAFIPKATFMNKQVVVKPFLATMKITPGSYISVDTVKDLAYDEKEQVSFSSWTPAEVGTYTVKIYTSLEYDENMANDTLTAEIIVTKNIGLDEEGNEIPDVYSLNQNYPNPFNPATVIRYGLPEAGQVELKVYDMLGREVSTLVSEFRNAGLHEVSFNAAGKNLSSGIYIYRIKSGAFTQTKKLMLIK